MGTTSEKLTYLNVTKQKLKQAINNIGGEVTDETTFRQYAEQLQNVYDILPKTAYAEGSNITLSNTLKGKLDFENNIVGYGDTKQEGTPTPDNPQEIEVVTGTIEVVERGINCCSNSSMLEGILINALQSKPVENYIALADVEEGEKYTISFTKSRVEGETIQNAQLYTYSKIEYYNGNTLISTVNATVSDVVSLSSGRSVNKLKVITIPTNCDNIKVYLINNNGDYTYNIKLEKVMILKGEYDSSNLPTYEPYITSTSYQLSLGDIELCGIGNYKDELIYDVENDRVYKNEKIGKKLYNGTEEWRLQSPDGIKQVYTRTENDYLRESGIGCYCNYYKGVENGPVGTIQDNECRFRYFSYDDLYEIYICNNSITSVNDFKTWLSSHNTEVRYVLATPRETEITDTTLINQVKALYNAHSNNGTTIITSNGDLPMIIKVRGLKGE